MKKYVLLWITLITVTLLAAQTKEELLTQKAEKEAAAGALASEIAAINAQLDAMPGWRKGSFGTIGFDLSSFDNWLTKANPNSSATTIIGSINGFANLIEEDFFWRNSMNLAVGWQKLEIDKNDPLESSDFEQVTDAFVANSLYGRNLTKIVAASAMAELRTTLLSNAFNPGYLDLGVGATLTPAPPLIILVHPLNYNFVIAEEDAAYESSAGAKIMADFNKELLPGINFKSNISSFVSYKDADLSNFTWINSLGFTAFKGVGVGIEYAVRANRQETNAAGAENVRQSYWIVGLSYNL